MLDLAQPAAALAWQVDEALRKYGFFYVCNHGIPEELIAKQCVPRNEDQQALRRGLSLTLTP